MYQDIFFLEPDSFYHGRTNSTHCTLRTTRAACGPATPLADGSRSSLLNLDQLPGVGGRSCCQCGAFQGFHAAVGREARGGRSSRSDAAASGLVLDGGEYSQNPFPKPPINNRVLKPISGLGTPGDPLVSHRFTHLINFSGGFMQTRSLFNITFYSRTP
jgi:hypothetical protein